MNYHQTSAGMAHISKITETSKAVEQWECSRVSSGCAVYCKQNGKDGGHTDQGEAMP